MLFDDVRENFGDRGSFTCIHGGDIGRIKFAMEAAGDVERLRLMGEVEDEFAADESMLIGRCRGLIIVVVVTEVRCRR